LIAFANVTHYINIVANSFPNFPKSSQNYGHAGRGELSKSQAM